MLDCTNGERGVIAQIAPRNLTVVGMRVRLRPEIDEVHAVYFRGGLYVQTPLDSGSAYILNMLREGMLVDGEENLDEPVPNLASAKAEDCYTVYRFNLLVADYIRAFPAWQFEPDPR